MIWNQKLKSMVYGSFVFPNNPSECTYSCDKAFAKHKYPELIGVELEDMDADAVIITGTGEFFGEDAYTNWVNLNKEFNSPGVKKFYHPIYTDVSKALMTKLQSSLQPRENYVAYNFEIVQHTGVQVVDMYADGTSVISTQAISNVIASGGITDINKGDIIICNGPVYPQSTGGTLIEVLSNKVLTVTATDYTNRSAVFPVHVGSIGWVSISSVKKSNQVSATSKSTDIVYIVKSGDTLSKICARYNVDWKECALYNNIKNPNLIYPGQKIRIEQK